MNIYDPPTLPCTGFLRLNQILIHLNLSKTTWYDGIRTGRFPKPIKIGPRAARYRAEDIATLIESLSSQDAKEVQPRMPASIY